MTGCPGPPPPWHPLHCLPSANLTSVLCPQHQVSTPFLLSLFPAVAAQHCTSISPGQVFLCCSCLLLFKETGEQRKKGDRNWYGQGKEGRSRQTQTERRKFPWRTSCSGHTCGHRHTQTCTLISACPEIHLHTHFLLLSSGIVYSGVRSSGLELVAQSCVEKYVSTSKSLAFCIVEGL